MTPRSFLLRLIFIAMFTWIIGSLTESSWEGLYLAVLPFLFYEMLRPR